APRVDVAVRERAVGLALERRGRMNGGRHGAGGGVHRRARVNRDGLDPHDPAPCSTTASSGAHVSATGVFRGKPAACAWGTSTQKARPWTVTSRRTVAPRNVTT